MKSYGGNGGTENQWEMGKWEKAALATARAKRILVYGS